MDPAQVLREIAFQLERFGEPSYRVRAFRRAASVVDGLPAAELERRARAGTLTELSGIGKTTAGVIQEAVAGREIDYLAKLTEREAPELPDGGPLRRALRGDCHTHSDSSDGGSPIAEMAAAARSLGHEWIVLTDHSPTLTIANGLSPQRLRRQLEQVAELNKELVPFRVLTGIEVDILDDGSLDQEEDLLAELDIVVASVHSKLRMRAKQMTDRLLAAVSNPLVDVLGHCTGRLVTGKGRPESTFDARAVFAACHENTVAVEINSRPDRLDPPRRLLRQAADEGCFFAIDSDAHAPGQLSWQPYGCQRAEQCGIEPDEIINTLTAEDLLAWKAR